MEKPSQKKLGAQGRRAKALRERIKQLASRSSPRLGPKSPRELTDEAARKEWLKEKSKK